MDDIKSTSQRGVINLNIQYYFCKFMRSVSSWSSHRHQHHFPNQAAGYASQTEAWFCLLNELEILTVANLDHKSIRVIEEHLINRISTLIILHRPLNILDVQLLQSLLNRLHVPTLHACQHTQNTYVRIMWYIYYTMANNSRQKRNWKKKGEIRIS